MQTLKSLFDQAILIWNDATGAGRIGIALLVVMCVASITGIGYWAAQPNYVVLVSDVSPSQASQAIDALDAADIAYQVKGSGTIIMVDKQQRALAKIALGGLGIDPDHVLQDELSPWLDPTTQKNIINRNLERRIEASIAKLKQVDSANVLLSIPKTEPFLRESHAPSAAVVVEINPNAKFSKSHAISIAKTVANSVPGMQESDVAVSDTTGTTYTTDESNAHLGTQDEYQTNRERKLERKIREILNPLLGFENISVAVTTDFTFRMGTEVTSKVDPDSKILAYEKVNNSTATSIGSASNVAAGLAPDAASGIAGSGSNIATQTSGFDKDAKVLSKTEDTESKFLVSKVERSETINTPVINKLTASVLVNQTKVQDENNAIPPGLAEKIESLVANAIGLSVETDQITVQFLEFAEDTTVVPPVASSIPWEQINEILKNISLGLGALVAMFLGMKVIKKFQPEPAGATVVAEPETKLSELAEMVQENPDIFAKIIASWSSADVVDEEVERVA